MQRNFPGRVLAPVILSCALAACGDAPTMPRDPLPAPARSSASFASTLDVGSGTITLWDEGGVGYTLDGARSEIRVTDGSTIELSQSDLATAVNAFVMTLEGDQLSRSLAASPPPTNTACELGWETCERNDLFLVDGGGLPVIGAPVDGGEQTSFLTQSSCRDIAMSIFDASQTHRQRRTEVTEAYHVAPRLGVGSVGLRVRFSDLPGAAQRAEVAVANQAKSTTQLNVLAVLYSTYNCWSNSWPGAVGSTTIPGMPGFTKVCRTSTEDFELSNGIIVRREVTVCEVRMQ